MLKKINLSWNGLDCDSHNSRLLSEIIATNKILTELDLSHNRFTSECISSLGKSLRDNSTLLKLNLGNNPIGYDAALYLCEALYNNTTLVELSIHNVSSQYDQSDSHEKVLEYYGSNPRIKLSLMLETVVDDFLKKSISRDTSIGNFGSVKSLN
jgi:hypothetical protein